MSTTCQAKAARRKARNDIRYQSKRRDPEAARRREQDKINKQRDMAARKGSKK